MSDAPTPRTMSPKLLKVTERAKWDPRAQMRSIAHVIDQDVLNEAFDRIRKDAAMGVDGVSKEQYGERLQDNLRALHERMKGGQYRHQPIRRVHIPKAPGKTRPIGISTVEDKVVQNALTMVLTAIYEPVFFDGSYGFRPGRSAHDALRALDAAAMRGECNWVLEADIESFFDSLDRRRLMEMLRQRVADEGFLRLVGKCLHVGVMDGEEYTEPDVGTAQGSTLSPMLGNIYLHHVLDLWYENEVKAKLAGSCLVRYADDFVIGFQKREDAELVKQMLYQRMAEYGLRLHPEKTRLVPYQRPPRQQMGGKGPGTFDFLGFTLHWRRTRRGFWVQAFSTRTARLQRAQKALAEYCRSHRHDSVREQHAALCRRMRGHYNYFGVNGNHASLRRLYRAARRIWFKWLNRRSQRKHLNWQRYEGILHSFPLPRPSIRVQIWAPSR